MLQDSDLIRFTWSRLEVTQETHFVTVETPVVRDVRDWPVRLPPHPPQDPMGRTATATDKASVDTCV